MHELEHLPGAELILPGLTDIQTGRWDTVSALLIAIASMRLRQAGLAIPPNFTVADAELRLYARLQQEQPDAYSYYNALLTSLDSFCNALESPGTTDSPLPGLNFLV